MVRDHDLQGACHGIHAVDPRRPGRPCGAARGRALHRAGCLRRLLRGAAAGRRAARRKPAAAGRHRDDGQGARRPHRGAERSVHRDARAARWLLPDRRARPGRRAVLGRALPRGRPRRGRGAADLGDGGGLSGVAADAVASAARAHAEGAARRSYGKLVAVLAARTRDLAGAEDALADAFAAALVEWPARGVPANAEAWLLTVARRRLVDAWRRQRLDEQASAHLALLDQLAEPQARGGLPDRRLELLFACAHPAIDRGVRAPLMLQTVLGFDAATIASAFLIAPAAMGQRLVRAKARILQAGIGLELPVRAQLPERLDAVLEAVYAAYAESWVDAEGADPRRRNLADEAIWLGRLTAALLPQEPEALGLLALMLHAHARRAARRDATGDYVPLDRQDTALWDRGLIAEAEDLLQRAGEFKRV